MMFCLINCTRNNFQLQIMHGRMVYICDDRHPIESKNRTKNTGCSAYSVEVQAQIQIQDKSDKEKTTLTQTGQKSKNESSTKSFRIKNKTTSKKSIKNKAILDVIRKMNNKKRQGPTRMKRLSHEKDKLYEPGSTLASKNQFIKRKISYQATKEKNQNINKKCQIFRRTKFQSKSRNQTDNPKDIGKTINEVSKYGHTDINTNRPIKQESSKQIYKIYVGETKKFRKGKYEVLYSSATSNEINATQLNPQPSKSQNYIEIGKKQSNFSIYKQNDLLADKQMQKFYSQLRNKQIEKHLEIHSEKYFELESRCKTQKSKCDIEFFVNSVKTPSIIRLNDNISNKLSQQDSADVPQIQKNTHGLINLLTYDFEFQGTQNLFNGKNPIYHHHSEQDKEQVNEESSFQHQRKMVQIEHFLKKIPHVNWSQSDCQIDEV